MEARFRFPELTKISVFWKGGVLNKRTAQHFWVILLKLWLWWKYSRVDYFFENIINNYVNFINVSSSLQTMSLSLSCPWSWDRTWLPQAVYLCFSVPAATAKSAKNSASGRCRFAAAFKFPIVTHHACLQHHPHRLQRLLSFQLENQFLPQLQGLMILPIKKEFHFRKGW